MANTERTAGATPAFDLVLACCSVTEGRAARITAALQNAPGDETFWQRALKITGRHRVSGLVFRALQDHNIPQEVRRALAQMALQQTLLATRLSLETILVQRLLHRAGVPVVFPKGAALARRLYGDIAPRHSRDVDAFVPAGAMGAAHAAMIAAGYQQIFPARPFSDIAHVIGHSVNYQDPVRRLLIELHWGFDENPVLDPCPGQPGPLPDPLPEKTADEQIVLLPDADLLIYLSLHGASHSWMRLKWLADIAALVPQLSDLAGIIRAAEARGLIRPVAAALILIRDLMGWDMPDAIATALPGDKGTARMVRAAKRTLTCGGGTITPYDARFGTTRLKLARLAIRRDTRFRLAEIRAILRSFFDADATPYLPRALRPLFPILKIPFWVWKHAHRSAP